MTYLCSDMSIILGKKMFLHEFSVHYDLSFEPLHIRYFIVNDFWVISND